MTKITVDKALIEQAIDLLDNGVCDFRCEYDDKAEGIIQPLRAALEQPPTQTGVGNSWFDHKIAADFMSGREINDENVRKFVMASRWAHDDRASLQVLVATLRQDVAARDAEIALLKQSLLDAEALAEPAVEPAAYRYKYLNFMGDEVWSQDMPRNGKVLETQALYTSPPPPAEVPLTTEEYTAMAHRIASKYAHRSDPQHIAYTFLPNTLEQFVRAIEALSHQKAGLK